MDILILFAGFVVGFFTACLLYDDKINPKKD